MIEECQICVASTIKDLFNFNFDSEHYCIQPSIKNKIVLKFKLIHCNKRVHVQLIFENL